MGLILLDGSSLLELGREKFRSMFGELGVNSLLKERVIAVTWEDALGERELFRVLREMGHEWDRLPVLVIIITETPLRPVIPGSAQVPAVFEIREPDPFARKDMGMRYAKKWQIPFEDGFGGNVAEIPFHSGGSSRTCWNRRRIWLLRAMRKFHRGKN